MGLENVMPPLNRKPFRYSSTQLVQEERTREAAFRIQRETCSWKAYISAISVFSFFSVFQLHLAN